MKIMLYLCNVKIKQEVYMSKITLRSQSINIYFNEVKQNTNLTKEDEIKLFTALHKGDTTATGKIFNKMAKLAIKFAKEFTNDPMLLEDLIQEANIGILEAIPLFDVNLGFRFSSFARHYMLLHIRQHIAKNQAVNVSSPYLIQVVNKMKKNFYNQNQRDPETYEIIAALEDMGIQVKDTAMLDKIMVSAIDAPVGTDEGKVPGYEVGEIARRTSINSDVNTLADVEDLKFKVGKMLSTLDPRDQKIVRLYFGIGVDFPMDYTTLGKMFHMTDERARQIVQTSLAKMRSNQ